MSTLKPIVAAIERRIVHSHDAPEFLRVPFINFGYRVGYCPKSCVGSLLQVHNETVNIWSHLLGTLGLVALMARVYFLYREYDFSHIFFSSIFIFCAAFGLFASTVFHLFNCINVDYHTRLRTMDFGGIAANVLGACFPTIYYAFYCHSMVHDFYMLCLSILTPALLSLPFLQFFHKHTTLRSLLYVLPAGIPGYCCLHLVYLEGIEHPLLEILFLPIFVAYLIFGLGLFLYLSRLPERLSPGAFDLLGTSHQIWHFLVLFGQWTLYYGITNALEYRLSHRCSDSIL